MIVYTKGDNGSEDIKAIYYMENGLITSYTESGSLYSIKYDENKRIIQIYNDYLTMTYKWNSSGDMCEKYDGNEFLCRYEYLSSLAQIPAKEASHNFITTDAYFGLDLFLLMQGYFGNSIPKHNLKSIYNGYSHTDHTSSFDTKGRCIEQRNIIGGKYIYIYRFKW